MKLKDTHICIDCDEVFQPRYPKILACPRCGSQQTTRLGKWIMPMSNLRELNRCSEKIESWRAA